MNNQTIDHLQIRWTTAIFRTSQCWL